MTGPEVALLSFCEALARLRSPWVLEEFSALTGAPALVVDLPAEDPPGLQPASLDEARRVLGRLPCPSIGLRGRQLSCAAQSLQPAFDLVVSEPVELELALDAIRRSPHASLALLQLLRHSQNLDIHEGLIAESLAYSVLQSGPEFGAWRGSRKRKSPEPGVGPAVLLQREGPRLLLTLNRPRRHNAFSAELRDAFVEGLQLALGDDSIEEIVLRGAGASFCSGGDLDEFGSLPDPSTAHVIRSTRNPARMLADQADRARAWVHGACIGAGAELPAFVSHVTAHPNARFALPEVAMGLVPGAGGTVSLPHRIGRQRTAWLALSGQEIDSSTALSWGLVDEVREFQLLPPT